MQTRDGAALLDGYPSGDPWTIRIPEHVRRRVKVAASRLNMTVGEALTPVIEQWLNNDVEEALTSGKPGCPCGHPDASYEVDGVKMCLRCAIRVDLQDKRTVDAFTETLDEATRECPTCGHAVAAEIAH